MSSCDAGASHTSFTTAYPKYWQMKPFSGTVVHVFIINRIVIVIAFIMYILWNMQMICLHYSEFTMKIKLIQPHALVNFTDSVKLLHCG